MSGELEHWRKIPGFLYVRVSNFGRVRSTDREIKQNISSKNNGDYSRVTKFKGRVLRPGISKLGYPIVVVLGKNKKRISQYVHRLVAIAFLSKPNGKNIEVNHIDGNKANCRLDNLEWITHAENMQHSVDTGLRKIFAGADHCHKNPKCKEYHVSRELYKAHRPQSLVDIVGQPEAVRKLQTMQKGGRFPHTVLLSGPSGCGKTTIARIFQSLLECGKGDFHEINAAEDRGIDLVREIKRRVSLAPMNGKVRIWLIDEAHQLTAPAQDAFLKELEDTPEWVYFILSTTDPHKLKKTIRTRCTDVVVKALNHKDMTTLLLSVLKKEKKKLGEEVLDKICEHSEGSARKALVLLNSVIDIKDEEEQIQTIEKSDVQHQAIEIARALLDPRTKWGTVATLIKAVEEDAESLRWMVLGYMDSVMLGGGKLAPRAYQIVTVFSEPFYNTKRAGLSAACWEVIHG